MSDKSGELLGDPEMIYVEPMDHGKRAMLIIATRTPNTINGKTTKHSMVVLEVEHLMQLTAGLMDVADMSEAAKAADRIIKTTMGDDAARRLRSP